LNIFFESAISQKNFYYQVTEFSTTISDKTGTVFEF